MLGQKKLKDTLSIYNVNNFPRTTLFVGPSGCGKHTIVKELSSKFKIDVEDITSIISLETITRIYEENVKKFYLINLDELTERHQNIILKFIEEPSSNAYVVLLSSSEQLLLKTVLNRCTKFKFDKYTKEELTNFVSIDVDNESFEILFKCCNTPGDVANVNYKLLKDMYELCDKIFEKIYVASLSNTLSIADKLNYKDNYDLFDVRLFLNLLLTVGVERIISHKSLSNRDYELMLIINKTSNRMFGKAFNKKLLIESMLFEMWRFVHGQTVTE